MSQAPDVSQLEIAAQVATCIGAPLAILALVYAGRQLSQSVAIARGQFMLELETMLKTHDPVHIRLRPGGTWESSDAGPKTTEEWAEVEDYMGFFEHCELLLQDGSLKCGSFVALFGYRVENIMANKVIVHAKLVNESDDWQPFLELLDRLTIPRPGL